MTAVQIYEVLIWTVFILMAIIVAFCLFGMVWNDVKKEKQHDRDKRYTKKHGKQFGSSAKDRKHSQGVVQDRKRS